MQELKKTASDKGLHQVMGGDFIYFEQPEPWNKTLLLLNYRS